MYEGFGSPKGFFGIGKVHEQFRIPARIATGNVPRVLIKIIIAVTSGFFLLGFELSSPDVYGFRWVE